MRKLPLRKRRKDILEVTGNSLPGEIFYGIQKDSTAETYRRRMIWGCVELSLMLLVLFFVVHVPMPNAVSEELKILEVAMPDRLGGGYYDDYAEWKRRNELDEDEYAPSMYNNMRWISVPLPMPEAKPDYDRDFLLTGATGGRVPPVIMERMLNSFRRGLS